MIVREITHPMHTLIEALGWYGAAAIVAAYALSSFGWLHPADAAYQMLNITGAFGIIIVSLKKRAYQPALLNAAWLTIAVIAVLKSA